MLVVLRTQLPQNGALQLVPCRVEVRLKLRSMAFVVASVLPGSRAPRCAPLPHRMTSRPLAKLKSRACVDCTRVSMGLV